jgi:hypothetical protein
MVARLNSIARSVIRGFVVSGGDRSEIAKALEKIRRCRAGAETGPPEASDLAVLPDLAHLSTWLESQLAPVGDNPMPTRELAPAPVDAPAPVFLPRPVADIPHPAPVAVPQMPAGRLDFGAVAKCPLKTRAVVLAILASLAGLYSRRRSLLADCSSIWRSLRSVDQQIAHAINSITWISEDAVPFATSSFVAAEDASERFASSLAMLRCGRAEPVLTYVTGEKPATHHDVDGACMAMRMCPSDSWLPMLTASSSGPGQRNHGLVALLSVLADRGTLSTDWLISCLDDSDDAVANQAAQLLAWLGRSPADRLAVESRQRSDAPIDRRCVLLFAAIALGSARALSDVRNLLDSGVPVTSRAIDALAVAGGPSDTLRLLGLAERQPELAAMGLLAVGHLGDASCATAISDAQVPDGVKSRALRAIHGERPAPMPTTSTGRLLHGEPWTVFGAIQRLMAPDELLQTRTWYALEIGVRSGLRSGVLFDAAAASSQQDSAAKAIQAAVEGARQTMAKGKWSFFGQPVG